MALAELFEHTAQLRLEQYRYDDDEGADHAAHDVRKAAKVEQVRRRADKADYHKTADKLHRPRADEQKQDSVYEESDYEYVQEVLPAQVEESHGAPLSRVSFSYYSARAGAKRNKKEGAAARGATVRAPSAEMRGCPSSPTPSSASRVSSASLRSVRRSSAARRGEALSRPRRDARGGRGASPSRPCCR